MTTTLRFVIGLVLAGSIGHAAVIINYSFDTTVLIGNPFTPFLVDFRLTDGKGSGDANNTATITNFISGGFGAFGNPTLIGGATGNLTSMVTLTDSSALNEFTQPFPVGPGSFTLTLTGNVDSGGTTDKFSFAVLDSLGLNGQSHSPIPTTGGGFGGNVGDYFLFADINSGNPTVQRFVIDPRRLSVPEPGTWVLLGAGLVVLCCMSRLSCKPSVATQRLE